MQDRQGTNNGIQVSVGGAARSTLRLWVKHNFTSTILDPAQLQQQPIPDPESQFALSSRITQRGMEPAMSKFVYNLLIEGALVNDPDMPGRTATDCGNLFSVDPKEIADRDLQQLERVKIREGILKAREMDGGEVTKQLEALKATKGKGKKNTFTPKQAELLAQRNKEDEILYNDVALPPKRPEAPVAGRLQVSEKGATNVAYNDVHAEGRERAD